MWQGQPWEACGWLVGRETLPRAPVVKGNRGINAQAGGLRPMGLSTFTCSQREPSSWSSMILNDEVSANAILKRVTKHYTVVIKPQTAT